MEYGNFGGIKKRLALFLILLLSFSQPLSVLADVKLTDSIDNEELMDSQEALSEEDIVETSDAISDIEENILSGSESDEQKDVLTDEAESNVIKEELTEDQDLKPVSEDSLDKLLDSIYNDPSLNDNEKEKKTAEIKAGYEPSEGASGDSGNLIKNEWLDFVVLQNGK